jgi:hypothetical protein
MPNVASQVTWSSTSPVYVPVIANGDTMVRYDAPHGPGNIVGVTATLSGTFSDTSVNISQAREVEVVYVERVPTSVAIYHDACNYCPPNVPCVGRHSCPLSIRQGFTSAQYRAKVLSQFFENITNRLPADELVWATSRDYEFLLPAEHPYFDDLDRGARINNMGVQIINGEYYNVITVTVHPLISLTDPNDLMTIRVETVSSPTHSDSIIVRLLPRPVLPTYIHVKPTTITPDGSGMDWLQGLNTYDLTLQRNSTQMLLAQVFDQDGFPITPAQLEEAGFSITWSSSNNASAVAMNFNMLSYLIIPLHGHLYNVQITALVNGPTRDIDDNPIVVSRVLNLNIVGAGMISAAFYLDLDLELEYPELEYPELEEDEEVVLEPEKEEDTDENTEEDTDAGIDDEVNEEEDNKDLVAEEAPETEDNLEVVHEEDEDKSVGTEESATYEVYEYEYLYLVVGEEAEKEVPEEEMTSTEPVAEMPQEEVSVPEPELAYAA